MPRLSRFRPSGLAAVAAVVLLGLLMGSRSHAAPPNIVLILADDLGSGGLGSYGNPDVQTPNLDRLAAEGIRFRQAYADSQCTPTRAALLSGQYGARTGVLRVFGERQPTNAYMIPAPGVDLTPAVGDLAQMLRSGGYATGFSGKWHVAVANATQAILNDPTRGMPYFDEFGFDYVGFARDPEGDASVTRITDELLGFIERNRTRPFFSYLSHFSPHTPLEAPPALIQKYVELGYLRSRNHYCRAVERPSADFLAMVEHLDASVGRLMDRLDTLGLKNNTMVIFAGDNGTWSRCNDNRPLREGKGSPYEGGIRIPLIVRWPAQIPAGRTSDTPVHVVDLYPTFAELAAVTLPTGRKVDGRSLVPVLRQTGSIPWRSLFWHMPTYSTIYGRTPASVIRQGDWKLVHYFGDYLDTSGMSPDRNPYGRLVIGERTELYNLRTDPSETTDLYQVEPDRAAKLKSILQQWWRRTGAPLPQRNDQYDPATWWQT